MNELVKEQTAQIENQSIQPRPKGLGKLTEQIITREVCDPKRFQNRRQVSSYLGLCPGEHSSGSHQQRGSSTKPGNPRLRWALCEAAWRLVRYQPDYRLCKKWREQILNLARMKARFTELALACIMLTTSAEKLLCTHEFHREVYGHQVRLCAGR